MKAKQRKIGHKCCAAAKCDFRSPNRPDLSFHEFPKDVNLRRSGKLQCEEEMLLSRPLVISFVVLHIFCGQTSRIV